MAEIRVCRLAVLLAPSHRRNNVIARSPASYTLQPTAYRQLRPSGVRAFHLWRPVGFPWALIYRSYTLDPWTLFSPPHFARFPPLELLSLPAEMCGRRVVRVGVVFEGWEAGEVGGSEKGQGGGYRCSRI